MQDFLLHAIIIQTNVQSCRYRHTLRRNVNHESKPIGTNADRCLQKDISSCTDKELYTGLLCLVNKLSKGRESAQGKKKLYYISAEFLIGKLLSNNMINLGICSQVKSILASHGKDLCVLEELEPEPSLGNGGLGRLAACFLDSIATLGLNGDGIGLNYHLACSSSYLKIISRMRSPTHGWKTPPG